MLYTEQTVRENLRNRGGKRVFFLGKGDQLTASARDYLNRERIEILPASQAKPQRYRLPGGGYIDNKPEHMTHLFGDFLVSKNHPRILFRGKMDTLEAELLLCQLAAPELRKPLGEILDAARMLIRREVLEEACEPMTLCGLTEEEIRSHSHFPQEYYAQPHFMPSVSDGEVILRLNRARCAAREAELSAVEAFTTSQGSTTRRDLIQSLNRLSSMLYILMIREKSKQSQG